MKLKVDYQGKDLEKIEPILESMNASIDHFEYSENKFLKIWVKNKEGQRVCWINLSDGYFHNLRFLRSKYTFNKEELTAKIEVFKKEKEIEGLKFQLDQQWERANIAEEKLESSRSNNLAYYALGVLDAIDAK